MSLFKLVSRGEHLEIVSFYFQVEVWLQGMTGRTKLDITKEKEHF